MLVVVTRGHGHKVLSAMQEHINKLATELGTKVTQGKNLPGMMFVEYEPPAVEGPLLDQKNNVYYPDLYCRFVVMLHELGHVKHGHTQGRPPYSDQVHYFTNGVLRSEAEAWDYALDQFELLQREVECKLSPASRKFMWERCLASYYQGYKKYKGKPSRLTNGNRHYVEFTYDEPDDYFWGVKERILG